MSSSLSDEPKEGEQEQHDASGAVGWKTGQRLPGDGVTQIIYL